MGCDWRDVLEAAYEAWMRPNHLTPLPPTPGQGRVVDSVIGKHGAHTSGIGAIKTKHYKGDFADGVVILHQYDEGRSLQRLRNVFEMNTEMLNQQGRCVMLPLMDVEKLFSRNSSIAGTKDLSSRKCNDEPRSMACGLMVRCVAMGAYSVQVGPSLMAQYPNPIRWKQPIQITRIEIVQFFKWRPRWRPTARTMWFPSRRTIPFGSTTSKSSSWGPRSDWALQLTVAHHCSTSFKDFRK